jgi:hypothetical protein
MKLKKWRNPNTLDMRIYVNGFDGDQSSPFFTKKGTKAELVLPKEARNPERMRREVEGFLYDDFGLQLEGLEWADVVRESSW